MVMGSPFLYIDRRELRVIFLRWFADGDPMGECELCLVWHCDNKGLTAKEAGRENCVNRARDPFTMENVVDIAGKRGRCRSQTLMIDGS
jgi:hypothetical protein